MDDFFDGGFYVITSERDWIAGCFLKKIAFLPEDGRTRTKNTRLVGRCYSVAVFRGTYFGPSEIFGSRGSASRILCWKRGQGPGT